MLSVKVDRKRKIPFTVLLRALGAVSDGVDDIPIKEGTDEELLSLFESVDNVPDHLYVASTIEHDTTKSAEEALQEFYRRMRPGDPTTLDNARSYLEALLFNPRRYDLGRVGRYKLTRRLEDDVPISRRTLTKRDLVELVKRIIQVNNGVKDPDDIDHLGNRRVKTVGELIQNQLRVGFLRMERVVRERMSIRDPEQVSPISLINVRPVVAIIREFFGGSQLSQFMQQTNPLDELTHKRTLSALGPGGLRRERAGFDVRDVHFSHYGRICPIETPEGPNIGLIGRLATYAEVNQYGFIETPYMRVSRMADNKPGQLLGRTLREAVADPGTGEVVADAGIMVDEELEARICALEVGQVRVAPYVTADIVYLSADEEERYVIAQANSPIDELGQFTTDRVSARVYDKFLIENTDRVSYMDVSPKQVVGISASLIPFLEHDDANRALMGSNMQRQAVPLVAPEAPVVGTGMETYAALDSGQVVTAGLAGEVVSVGGGRIVIQGEDGEETYELREFDRSNQSTFINQRAVVTKGDIVEAGQVIADTSSTQNGELALGQNVLGAFMFWEGGNFEDAILISEELVRQDKFTSIHIEKHEIEARDTKLGPEEITRDIPNVGEEALHNLDDEGVIYVGAEVGPGDILVGKITPKGETELTPEEKLLRAIFGEKAREVRDSSLRLPHGEEGKVVDVRVFTPRRASRFGRRCRKDGSRERRSAPQAHRGRQDGRSPREQGRYLPRVADRGYAFPGGCTPVQIILSPFGRAGPHERGPGAGDPLGLGRGQTRLPCDDTRVRWGQRRRDCGRAGPRLADGSGVARSGRAGMAMARGAGRRHGGIP